MKKTLSTILLGASLTLSTQIKAQNNDSLKQDFEIRYKCQGRKILETNPLLDSLGNVEGYKFIREKVPCFNKDGTANYRIIVAKFIKDNEVYIQYTKHIKNKDFPGSIFEEEVVIIEHEIYLENTAEERVSDYKINVREEFKILPNENNTFSYRKAIFVSPNEGDVGPSYYAKTSSEEKADEIFGELFMKRAKKILNTKDSLETVNLLKDEYQNWKILEFNDGTIAQITPIFSPVFFKEAIKGQAIYRKPKIN